MTPQQLQHLRDTGHGWAAEEIDMLRNAILDVLSYRVGDLPRLGYIRDNDRSRAAIARLSAIAAQEQKE